MHCGHVSEGNDYQMVAGQNSHLILVCPVTHQEFITVPCWAHIDIAGVMESHGEVPFLDKGMTGMFV